MRPCFFMHQQSLPEEDECTQASHYSIIGLGVVNLMGKCGNKGCHKKIKAPAAHNLLSGGLMTRALKNGG